MSGMSRDELERHLERLPKEGWDRPTPPPPRGRPRSRSRDAGAGSCSGPPRP